LIQSNFGTIEQYDKAGFQGTNWGRIASRKYMQNEPVADTQPLVLRGRKISRFWIVIAFLGIVALLMSALVGGLAGYQSAWQMNRMRQSEASSSALQEQYDLALQDMQTGQLDLARQRFEYILQRDPGFPGAAEGLAQAMSILFATATPTPVPPTVTPTPTQDLRPVQDMLAQAQTAFAEANWGIVIDTLVAMRDSDPGFQTVAADSLLYRALRNRGIDKIVKEANLEGGIYDLALSEGFGPLDAEANNWRNLARLYMIGSAFWEVFPEQAVNYFGQLAAAAPGLRDASGWTARERYRVSLLHLGNKLALAGDWCSAQEQYDLSLSIGGDASVVPTAAFAAEQCAPPTATITLTPIPEMTFTPTVTPTIPPGITPVNTPTNTPPSPSPTLDIVVTPTFTPTPTPTQPVVEPSVTLTPTQEQPPTPTETLPPPPDEPSATPEAGGQ
jgi:hypothetical protein